MMECAGQRESKKMGFSSFRYLRGLVLGLMFILAGTAFCWCDAYDPNPYDDIPPVVTVEFNYVVPAQTNIQAAHSVLRNSLKVLNSTQQQQRQPVDTLSINRQQTISALPQGTPPMFLPLRR
jgi:hypothetical protein